MRRRILTALALSAAIGASVTALPAGPAAAQEEPCGADRFCAYQHAGFRLRFLDSGAVRGQTVDIPDEILTSARNHRNNAWIGRDSRGILPDVTVFVFAPQTDISNVGAGANDRIDYLVVD